MNTHNPTHEKILRITRQLFIEKGIHNTSLADIASGAEISRGTLFYYYRSKNVLVCDILDHHYQEVSRAVSRQIGEISEGNSQRDALKVLISSLIEDQDIARLNLYMLEQALEENSGQFHEIVQKKYLAWHGLLEEFVKSYGRVADPSALASLLLAVIDGLLVQRVIMPEMIDLETIVDHLLVMAGYGNVLDGDEKNHG